VPVAEWEEKLEAVLWGGQSCPQPAGRLKAAAARIGSPNPSGPTSATTTATALNTTSPNFYWVAAGTNVVTLSVTDASGTPYTATATFTVVAPTYEIVTAKGSVGILNGHTLIYGVTQASGISLTATVTAPPGFNVGAQQQWVQIVAPSAPSTTIFRKYVAGSATQTCVSFGLDN